jgi:hypothetical protein
MLDVFLELIRAFLFINKKNFVHNGVDGAKVNFLSIF